MDFPCQPWFLIGPNGNGSGDYDIVQALPYVDSDSLRVLCLVVVAATIKFFILSINT